MRERRTTTRSWLGGARMHALAVGVAVAALPGCMGSSDMGSVLSGGPSAQGPGSGGGNPGTMPTSGNQKPSPPPPLAVGDAPLRRLTALEYTQSVNDLFGVNLDAAESWPASGSTTGFSGEVSGQGATADLVDQMLRSAERVADVVVAQLATIHPCAADAASDPVACGEAFIDTYARRAYRRPLNEADRAQLRTTLQWSLGRGNTLAAALRLVTIVMLQSPHFLYRPEIGGEEVVLEGKPLVRLTDHAVATRLAYLLTTSSPDEALLAAADRGELRTDEQLLSHARRLLQTPRGKATVQRFFREWLHLHKMDSTTKNVELFPEFSPAVRESLKKGTLARFDEVLFGSGPGDLGELLGATYTFVDQNTAPLLGLQDVPGQTLQRVETTDHPRSGLLTDLGLMAMLSSTQETSPVARGLFVWETLLCQVVSPPPADLNVEPPSPDPSLTTRERFAQHRDNAACAGCHQFFDPPGFALEQYDPLGRFRTLEHGLPIDATGTMPLEGAERSFDGAKELAQLLASSDLPQNCLTQKWFSFAMGRANGLSDAYSMHALQSLPSSTPLRELFLAIVQTPSFTHRPATAPEACTP